MTFRKTITQLPDYKMADCRNFEKTREIQPTRVIESMGVIESTRVIELTRVMEPTLVIEATGEIEYSMEIEKRRKPLSQSGTGQDWSGLVKLLPYRWTTNAAQ